MDYVGSTTPSNTVTLVGNWCFGVLDVVVLAKALASTTVPILICNAVIWIKISPYGHHTRSLCLFFFFVCFAVLLQTSGTAAVKHLISGLQSVTRGISRFLSAH